MVGDERFGAGVVFDCQRRGSVLLVGDHELVKQAVAGHPAEEPDSGPTDSRR